MTKTSIFGQSEVKQEEKKPIEFIEHLTKADLKFRKSKDNPKNWKNITLLQKSYNNDLDLMWAFDESPNQGYLYLGHWNDGIVK